MSFKLISSCVVILFIAFTTSTANETENNYRLTSSEENGDPCLLAPLLNGYQNLCLARKVRYTFDATTGHCKQFIYGGCLGSPNLYRSRRRCEEKCYHLLKPEISEETDLISEESDGDVPSGAVSGEAVEDVKNEMKDSEQLSEEEEICLLPPLLNGDNNLCLARKPRFTFDSTSGRCIKFIYGGCLGSENLFRTIEQCEEKCAHLINQGISDETLEDDEESSEENIGVEGDDYFLVEIASDESAEDEDAESDFIPPSDALEEEMEISEALTSETEE